jgi:hypothetical protein
MTLGRQKGPRRCCTRARRTATDSPYVTGSVMETGYVPFQQQPVYIGYGPSGVGTMTF